MNKQRIIITVFIPLVLLLGAAGLLTYAQGPADQDPREPEGTLGVLGTGFTYQGKLDLHGEPVNGECELIFCLYDGEAGAQVGQAITVTEKITGGLFTARLNTQNEFGPNPFAGEERWLGVEVLCPGDSDYADLGRQELTAAPYASYALSTGELHNFPLAATVPITRQVLEWDGAAWGPALDDGTAYSAGNQLDLDGTTLNVIEGIGSDLDADLLDGYHAGQLGLTHAHDHSTLAGLAGDDHPHYFHLSQDQTVSGRPAFNGGVSGFSSPFDVDSTTLVGNLNADLLDYQHGAFYRNANSINAGTLDPDYYSARADLVADGHLGDSAGDLAQNNSVVQSTLNADQLDGYHASDIMAAAGELEIYGVIDSASVTEIVSFTVDAPADGTLTLILVGSVFLDCDSSSSSSRLCSGAKMGICDSPASSASCGLSYDNSRLDFEDPDNAETTNEEHWITIARTVAVSAGSHVFYLNGQSYTTGMNMRINGYVTAIYTPGSMTVTVSSPQAESPTDNN